MYTAVKGRSSSLDSVPAPVAGINARDSIANMAPEFAIDMLNFLPGSRSVQCRQGYSKWVVGLPTVKTLSAYLDIAGTYRLFGFTDSGVYDVSAKASSPTVSKSITNGFVSTIMFGTIGGQYLVCCNGTDATFMYNGTSWITWTQVTTPTNPGEINGINPNKFSQVHSHKRRLWFVEKDSMTAWYLPVDSVGGEAKPLYLGSVFQRGGKLRNIYTWSLDSGSGLDDIIVFQSDQGELAGYEGNDPDIAASWALSAVHYVAPPFSSRAGVDMGGDLGLLTTAGVYQVSRVVAGIGAVSTSSEDTLSYNIGPIISRLVLERGESIGWELRMFASFNLMILLVPASFGFPAVQYTMNLQTGAWGRLDLPMRTAAAVKDKLFFSDASGNVYLYGQDIYVDDLSFDGQTYTPILASFQQAYNYFESRGQNKHFNLIRPIWIAQYPPSYYLMLSCDYTPQSIDSLPAPPTELSTTTYWNSAIWDTATWAPAVATQFRWDGLLGLGYCASLIVSVRVNKQTELVSCDWAYEIGTSL